MAAGIAATTLGFCQTPSVKDAAPGVAPVATTGTTLPVARTLTSADGRTIDVTIVSKSATAIRAARADGKEFEIALDKLSDADKAFVEGLVNAPVKKMKALVTGKLERLTTRMEKAGFEITKLNTAKELQTISDQKLEGFDAIVLVDDRLVPYIDAIQRDRLIKLTNDEKVIAWRHYYKTEKRDFIKKKTAPSLFKGSGEMRDQEPFIDVQGNAIFYSWTKSNDKTGGEISDDTILDQVVVELKRLIKNQAK